MLFLNITLFQNTYVNHGLIWNCAASYSWNPDTVTVARDQHGPSVGELQKYALIVNEYVNQPLDAWDIQGKNFKCFGFFHCIYVLTDASKIIFTFDLSNKF